MQFDVKKSHIFLHVPFFYSTFAAENELCKLRNAQCVLL